MIAEVDAKIQNLRDVAAADHGLATEAAGAFKSCSAINGLPPN
ncbi:MAG: hypothetical protein ACLSE6_07865 [Alphaproteobacteria bacterium]